MIEFQFESWEQFYSDPDLNGLMQEHAKELIPRHGSTVPMELNAKTYPEMDKAGMLVILTVRDDSKLIGYCLALVSRHLRYPIVCGFVDMHYLTPAYRGRSLGKKLITDMIAELKRRGCQQQYWGAISTSGQAGLFKSLGMVEQETVYRLTEN